MKKIIAITVVALGVGVMIFLTNTQKKEMNFAPSLEINTNIMKITSSAFAHNQKIPSKYTCDGDNISPPLTIEDIPANTKSMVLIVDDPDAPSGTWVHWTVWNIDPNKTEIIESNIPGVEGITSFGKPGYEGPCPPSGVHRYFFKLYALDNLLNLSTLIDASQLEQAMEGHILSQAELMGSYSRS